MPIPPNFLFTQANLQDFSDCPKRFYLRCIRRLAWPAVEAEPALESERLRLQGERFHILVYQSLLGISSDKLDRMVQDADLALWWRSLRAALPELRSGSSRLYPEVSLRAPLAGYSLAARCDLVALGRDGRLRIFDWKTSQRRASRDRLAGRLQTRVYPYLLVRDGARLNGGQPVQPEQVEMVYWFARYPAQPERFAYSQAQYQADEAHLAALIERIAAMQDGDFLPGPPDGRSQYCVYRSLCERGVSAGDVSGWEADGAEAGGPDLDFDFEQVEEVAYW